jgi:hypothetical protein
LSARSHDSLILAAAIINRDIVNGIVVNHREFRVGREWGRAHFADAMAQLHTEAKIF